MDLSKTLFVVHTMGRVGSRAIMDSLQRDQDMTGEPRNRVHCHYLTFPYRKVDREAVEIIENWEGPKVVISAVRDPIARNLSAYYVNHHLSKGMPLTVEGFLEGYPHRTPLDFYFGEYADYWKVDIVASVQESLHFTLDGVDHLILYSLDDWELATDIVLGKPFPVLHRVGEVEDVNYRKFINTIELPEWYIDRMYESLFARTFFTYTQINELRERWLHGR